MTIIAPLFLLDFLVIIIFYSKGDLDTKMGFLATILLALLAYQQSFRQSIPVIPKVTLGDYIVLTSLTLILVASIDSFTRFMNGDIQDSQS